MKKKLAWLCGLLTAATFMSAALPPVAPVARAGIDWGKVIGDIITGTAKTGNNGSNNSGSGSPSPGIGNLSNQKHAHPNLTNDEKLFILAIEKNDIGTAQSTLDTGIDIEMVFKTSYQGIGGYQNTPLGIAIINNNRDMMQFLLEHGANINGFYDYDNNYRSYFAYAGRFVQKDLLEYLHNWGANINGVDSCYNENSLDKMYWNGQFDSNRFECAKYLLENGINPDNIPKNGSPVLCIAVERSDYQMIDLLANYGANLNIRDKQGRSVLDIALNKKDLQLYKYVQDVIARGQQPSRYRAVKEAEKNKKIKTQQNNKFNQDVTKYYEVANPIQAEVTNALQKFSEVFDYARAKDYISQAKNAKKAHSQVVDSLKKYKNYTSRLTFENWPTEEGNLLKEIISGKVICYEKTAEQMSYFTVERDLTSEEYNKMMSAMKESSEKNKEIYEKERKFSDMLNKHRSQ